MEPLIITGPEQSLVDPTLADAGLPPAVGVQSFQVFRALRAVPEFTDLKGWTYHHHVDMACWQGSLYVAWNSCERDEDVWPSRELYSMSVDGMSWSPPEELFPQGVSTALRMYFFRAPNGRMLAIAGLRPDLADVEEDRKGGLVVREIDGEHSLGEVFTLRLVGSVPHAPPMFDTCADAGFVEACRALLANRIFLEQQDRGRLLGERRMKWHDASAWPEGKVPGDDAKWVCGKAFSFVQRNDDTRIGICKMGFVTTSTDGGETWSMPVIPPTLVTGKAKVWSQRTADGRFALVYNPSRKTRYPLIVVTSRDGITFGDMRIVQGELPVQRYPGKFRSIGPQYVRGISEWSNDRSRHEQAMWLVYSMNKEDIWVTRVPVPLRAAESRPSIEGFGDFNLYVPKWSSATINGDEMRLENFDPHDYVRATRVFRETQRVRISFELLAEQADGSGLEIDVLTTFGSRTRALVRSADLGLAPEDWRTIEIDARAEPGETLNRVSFRTGAARNIGGANPVPVESDRPTEPLAFRLRNLRITSEL